MKYTIIFDDGEIRHMTGCNNLKEAVEAEMKLNQDKEIISASLCGFDKSD